MKVRNCNLAKTYHLNVEKEDLLRVFEENARRAEREQAITAAAREQLSRFNEGIADRADRAATPGDCPAGVGNRAEEPGNRELEDRIQKTTGDEREPAQKSLGRSR